MNRLAFALSVLCLTHFTGWSQNASLSTNSTFFSFECEGNSFIVFPEVIGFNGPYTFELKFDGLAPDIVGTNVDLQPSYTVQASTPGVYAFELIATDGFTMVEALPVSFEVGATVEGSLSLASLGAGFFEDNISGPNTTFLHCGGSPASVDMEFDVSLNGPADAGTFVVIDWGDGNISTDADFVGSTISHNYAPGSWQIAMAVEHATNGISFPCPQTKLYNVFVGTAPEPSLTLGESELCLNNPMAEIVLGNNSSTELTWEVQFNDGSQPTTVGPTTDDDILFLHIFTTTSCDSESNGFMVSVNAQNGCGSTFLNGGPFKVSTPPVLDIASATGSVACPYDPVMLTNASTPPQLNTPFGCTDSYTYLWELDPGLTLLSGDLGSDNGFVAQPEFWSSGNPEIEVTSSTPGVYQIDLIAFSNSACGVDSASFYLNVEASPVCECDILLPAISLDDVEVCPGELVPSLELPALDDLTWGWYNDNPTTGLGASGLGDIPAWEALPNTSDTANSGTVTVIGQLPGCFAVEAGSYQISVLAEGCEVGCVSDINNNGVCDDQEVLGCTYAFAQNYNPEATDDDGSCTIAECEATEQNECVVEGDFDGDGIVGTGDLLAFLTLFGDEFQDSDGDGLCDELDDCFGVYDECGVCAGPGAIYDCGCETCPSFQSCGDPISYHGYDYATVLIGESCWFAENLRTQVYSNGDSIPSGLTDALWSETTSGATTIYGEGISECSSASPDGNACDEMWSLNQYGRLYNWYAVDDPRALCPSGWHVSDFEEWDWLAFDLCGQFLNDTNSLFYEYLSAPAAVSLKTTYGWLNGGNGTNESGFFALPGGDRADSGEFIQAGSGGYWWTSTMSSDNPWWMCLDASTENLISGHDVGLRYALSVRCIKDY